MTPQALCRPGKLAGSLAQAKREWEELDPAYTSFEMRKRAENRFLTLLRLGQKWGIA